MAESIPEPESDLPSPLRSFLGAVDSGDRTDPSVLAVFPGLRQTDAIGCRSKSNEQRAEEVSAENGKSQL